jgi:phytol kinase
MTGADAGFAALWVGATIGLVTLAGMLYARFGTRPELLRQITHIGTGMLVLLAPAYFSSPVPVLAVSALYAPVLCLAAHRRWPRAVHGVARRSQGSAYFALAVFLLAALFWRSHLEAFLGGIIVLGFGDGLAGTVGELAGRRRYTIGRNTRSLEGSLTMFVASAGALTALLLARGTTPPDVAVATALTVAALATVVEAVSPGGSDNLWVPLVAGLALFRLLP